MKYTLSKESSQDTYWNGEKSLPDEINVLQFHPQMAEFELLSVICTLHGFVTAFDLLSGSSTHTEKDKDIEAVLIAFQNYLHPRMPLSRYTGDEKRMRALTDRKIIPIESPL